MAQIQQPPRHDSQSSTGVSYRNLSFNWKEIDLSIGGDGHEGLTLERSYNSNMSNSYMGDGWNNNFYSLVTVDVVPTEPDLEPLPPHLVKHIWTVSFDSQSYSFIGGSNYPNVGPFGPFRSVSKNGTNLVFNGTAFAGYFTFTGSDGSVVNFTSGLGRVSNKTYPDGTRLDFTYSGAQLKSVFSSRGYAILFESPTTACAINLATTYVSTTDICPAGVQRVTYGFSVAAFRPPASLLTSVTRDGATTTYGYSGADHLSCVTDPGQSVCRVNNLYNVCPPTPAIPDDDESSLRYRDAVTFQQTATGETYSYSTNLDTCSPTDPDQVDYFAWLPNVTTVTAADGSRTSVEANTGGLPQTITDGLGRSTIVHYETNLLLDMESVDVAGVINAEGNSLVYSRDDRGNIYQIRMVAKPGSGQADTISTAAYPSVCSNYVTCNKPTSVTDASGNVTDYVYDPAHGGVLSETGPSVGGVRPQKRYEYGQRYAWVKNSSGGYVRAASPIWVLTREEYCKTSAASGSGCSAGASDEVVTAYDYGPDSGPNNLLLRGMAVTADGQTLRTCFAYDDLGRRISETQPLANLTTCP